MLASLLVELLAIVDPFDNRGTSSPWAMELPDKKRGLEIEAVALQREREDGCKGKIHQNAISIEPPQSYWLFQRKQLRWFEPAWTLLCDKISANWRRLFVL